jgi:hypothetical protein
MHAHARAACRNLLLAAIVLPALAEGAAATPVTVTATMGIQYFEVPLGTPDFYASGKGSIGVSNNYVTSTLGPDGLPVFNPSYTTASGTVHAPSSASLVAGTNEINWWSPQYNSNVKADGTGTIQLPFASTAMFPPPATNDNTDFLTAIITGSFTLPVGTGPGGTTDVTFNLGADDVAFLYIDGSLVTALGGIHGDTAAPTANDYLSAGTHTIELFYGDLEQTQAALTFSVLTPPGLIITPIREPGSLALLLGALPLMLVRKRFFFEKKKQKTFMT